MNLAGLQSDVGMFESDGRAIGLADAGGAHLARQGWPLPGAGAACGIRHSLSSQYSRAAPLTGTFSENVPIDDGLSDFGQAHLFDFVAQISEKRLSSSSSH
ncbi:hypothetical protein [Pseudoxanthobacter soli]|uniref:hypothetical protein n=1 Tax=Pseudoxanthobacter soli TaxID=433840 RepID=UPI001FCD9A9B|nr:hypothetical protein [Pseudoxanthobacter soli]